MVARLAAAAMLLPMLGCMPASNTITRSVLLHCCFLQRARARVRERLKGSFVTLKAFIALLLLKELVPGLRRGLQRQLDSALVFPSNLVA